MATADVPADQVDRYLPSVRAWVGGEKRMRRSRALFQLARPRRARTHARGRFVEPKRDPHGRAPGPECVAISWGEREGMATPAGGEVVVVAMMATRCKCRANRWRRVLVPLRLIGLGSRNDGVRASSSAISEGDGPLRIASGDRERA